MAEIIDETADFLDSSLTRKLNRLDDHLENARYANIPEASGAESLANYAFNDWTRLQSRMQLPYVSGGDNINEVNSQKALNRAMALSTYRVLERDYQHAIITEVGALVTGVALLRSDEDAAARGFDFGKKVIKKRAMLAAHNLTVALVNPNSIQDFEGSTNLRVRADKYHESLKWSRSPLREVPRATGKRVDALIKKMYQPDFVTDLGIGVNIKRSRSHGINCFRLAYRYAGLSADLTDKFDAQSDQATEILDEAFDTFVSTPDFNITEQEIGLVFDFAPRVSRYLQIAGEDDPLIGEDPRVKHLGALVARLPRRDILKAAARYKQTAFSVVEREKEAA